MRASESKEDEATVSRCWLGASKPPRRPCLRWTTTQIGDMRQLVMSVKVVPQGRSLAMRNDGMRRGSASVERRTFHVVWQGLLEPP